MIFLPVPISMIAQDDGVGHLENNGRRALSHHKDVSPHCVKLYAQMLLGSVKCY